MAYVFNNTTATQDDIGAKHANQPLEAIMPQQTRTMH
jgi:hypothetical protein